MKKLLLLILVLFACEATEKEPDPAFTKACSRAFAPTLDVWERSLGPVPKECRLLDKEYEISEVDEIPKEICMMEISSITVGCFSPAEKIIYVLEDRNDVSKTNTAIHEWLHVIHLCVYGSVDMLHLRGQVWAEYGEGTIEIQAATEVTIGRCL